MSNTLFTGDISGNISYMSASAGGPVLKLFSSGSTIMAISGNSTPILDVSDININVPDIFVVTSASIDLFLVNKSKIVAVSGSLTVSESVYGKNFTSSLSNAVGYFGTSSFAVSASYAANGGGSATADPLIQIYYRSRFN